MIRDRDGSSKSGVMPPTAAAEPCPLCQASDGVQPFDADRARSYLRCGVCSLVFVPRAQHPSPRAAKERYDLHRNDPGDSGYRRFLNRLVDPLAPRLRPGAEGLDFGCGPSPVLSLLLAERGFRMANYDPFYAPDTRVLQRTYDFLVCSETVEHFSEPRRDLDRMLRLVRAGGWVGIMTGMLEPGIVFLKWPYANDLTHVCFFSRRTFEWWAGQHGLAVEFPAGNVCLMQRR